MKYLSNAAGQALVLVVMVTLLMLFMSFTALNLVGTYRKTSFTEKTMAQAYYIADAGVEHALARAKTDSDWLWHTVHGGAGQEVVLITGRSYAGGVIARVTVQETGIYPAAPLSRHDVVYTDIRVTAEGVYEDSRKTLVVQARVSAPLPFAKGIWVAAPHPEFGRSVINAPVTVSGALTFRHNCLVQGIITAGGNVTVAENVAVTAEEVKSAGGVYLENNAQINGRVRQADVSPARVALAGGALIGRVETDGEQEVTNFADIYYNGELHNDSGRVLDSARLHPGQAGTVNLPSFPARQASMFAKSYDQWCAGDKTLAGDFELSGVTYVAGDLTISGCYRGVGAIVCRGDVHIPGDLCREQGAPDASLAILCFGRGGVNIADGVQVWALLYTPPGEPSARRTVHIGRGAAVRGSILCDHLAVTEAGAALMQYESSLAGNLPDWLTTHISITSWQELYPVF